MKGKELLSPSNTTLGSLMLQERALALARAVRTHTTARLTARKRVASSLSSSSATFSLGRDHLAAQWQPARLAPVSYASRTFSTSTPRRQNPQQQPLPRLGEFPPERIRNFGVLAHIDSGKSA